MGPLALEPLWSLRQDETIWHIYRSNHDPLLFGPTRKQPLSVRFDNDELCIALFDRARDAVIVGESVGIMDDPAWLGTLLDRYGIGLDQ